MAVFLGYSKCFTSANLRILRRGTPARIIRSKIGHHFLDQVTFFLQNGRQLLAG
jgi:hypothetical protein